EGLGCSRISDNQHMGSRSERYPEVGCAESRRVDDDGSNKRADLAVADAELERECVVGLDLLGGGRITIGAYQQRIGSLTDLDGTGCDGTRQCNFVVGGLRGEKRAARRHQ